MKMGSMKGLMLIIYGYTMDILFFKFSDYGGNVSVAVKGTIPNYNLQVQSVVTK